MHDIDRTMGRTNMETYEGEWESAGEGELAGEGEGEFSGEAGYAGEREYAGEGEFAGEGEYAGESEYAGEGEYAGESEYEGEGEYAGEVMGEEEVNELAMELLEVASEQELQQFLGNLAGQAASAVGGFLRSPVARRMGGMLRNVAVRALQGAGQAVASGLSGAGGPEGDAGEMLGLELEGLSMEDRDFEVARQVVRLAADAAQTAAQAPPGAHPAAVARHAMTEAAHRFAPGLLGDAGPGGAGIPFPSGATSGRWTLQNNQLVVHGI